ncbi:hypothetical protein LMG26857_03615 [Achromobacter anxifer]|nr:hypothetical protein LMG26857_03615 [Achromobacter anxifer]
MRTQSSVVNAPRVTLCPSFVSIVLEHVVVRLRRTESLIESFTQIFECDNAASHAVRRQEGKQGFGQCPGTEAMGAIDPPDLLRQRIDVELGRSG